jgi:4-hydroxyphenylacetate 3-hydroxylase, reductase component
MPYHGGLMSFDAKALRGALGRYATGVTITTCRSADGQPVGLTVNSFGALSLEPPLVTWALRAASPALPAFRQASHFAVNVLSEAQLELSRRFASPVHDRFAEGEWIKGHGGAPVLAGCCATLECATERELVLGDHVLFVGRVLALSQAALAPLVFQGGHYHHLGRTL